MFLKDFPVDIVYTWVDGSDQRWLSKKKSVLANYAKYHQSSDVSGVKRFINKEELRFSIRSIDRFCPWVRNIYIITDNQTPGWLKLDNNNLIIVDHKDVFKNKDCLPCYNSNAIETRLHHIRGLSKTFLSFNDDFFVGRPCQKEDFFYEDGSPKLYVGRPVSKLKLKVRFMFPKLKKINAHASALSNSRKLVFEKYKKLINKNLTHTIKALNKESLVNVEGLFESACKKTSKNQFRDSTDIWIMALHAYYLIAERLNSPIYVQKIKKIDFLNKINLRLNKKLDYGYIGLNSGNQKVEHYLGLIKKYRPLSFCLNDWPGNNQAVDEIIYGFLNEMFPEKSKYEK